MLFLLLKYNIIFNYMPFNVNNTNVDIKTYFVTSTQTLPVIGYTNKGTTLTNIALYMFGTRSKCNYQQKGTDLSAFYQQDTFDECIELGAYTMAPWNLTATQLSGAKWIWASANANINAYGNSNGKYYWFYYTFYYNGSNTPGTFYIACDNNAVVFFNSDSVKTLASDSPSNSLLNSIPISINNGLNYIRIAAYNSGYIGSSSITYTNGTISTSGTNTIYTFLTSGTITFSSIINISILIVGGGGGGGRGGGTTNVIGGGGGGGGTVNYITNYQITSTSPYTITVGAGGIAGNGNGSSGIQSSFDSLIAEGGRGGKRSDAGGTGGNYSSTNTGDGGDNGRGGGGGGAGGDASGITGGSSISNSITGTSIYYGGGGGGGASSDKIAGAAGTGNNGNGGGYNSKGIVSTQFGGGGGGGSGGIENTQFSGGNGGPGIVIISVNTTDIIESPPNPAGLICSVHDSTSPIANTNSDWAYSLSITAASATTSNYYSSGAKEFNLLT
jgi:hypothetical protein